MSDWRGWTTIFCSDTLGTSRLANFTSRRFFVPEEAGLSRSDGEPRGQSLFFVSIVSRGSLFALDS